MNERDKLIEKLIREKGGTRKQYLQLLDMIGYHESAGTLDPSIKQFGGGPGRGKYQFEEGTNAGGITAARRTKQYYDAKGIPVPEWLNKAASGNSLDATALSSEQQDILFLGNMRMHPKANFSNVWDGKESIADFWANYHWAGDPLDKRTRLKSFNDSSDRFVKKYSGKYDFTDVLKKKRQDNFAVELERMDNSYNPQKERLDAVVKQDATEVKQPSLKVGNFNATTIPHAYGGNIDDCQCGCPGKPPCPEKVSSSTRVGVNKYDKVYDPSTLARKTREKYGEIKPHTPQSTLDKTIDVINNPTTALGYAARGERLPDNFSKGKRNATDYAIDVINPAHYAVSGKELGEGIIEGDINKVVLGGLGIAPLPLIDKATRPLRKKAIKSVDKSISKMNPNSRQNVLLKMDSEVNDYNKLGFERVQEGIKGKEHLREEINRLTNTAEGRRRLKEQGLMESPTAQYLSNTRMSMHSDGSAANGLLNHIRLDPSDAIRLKYYAKGPGSTTKSTVSHELAHLLQYNPLKYRSSYPNVADEGYASKLIGERNLSKLQLKPRGLLKDYPRDNSQAYFAKGSGGLEMYPFLREMRQTMKDEGYINDIYQNITPDVIKEFMKKGNSRIGTFALNNKYNRKILSDAMNTLPAIGAAAVIGSQVTNEKAYGGSMNGNTIEKLNIFGTGGLHENNPHGGIPQGIGNNGKLNTVEQGEVSYDTPNGKYIFSNRLGSNGTKLM